MGNGEFPLYYYAMIVAVYMVHQVFLYSMFVSIMAFFARISDPAVGGTYMTFLNTLTNLGGNWPATLALWWVDVLTLKKCQGAGKSPDGQIVENACETADKVTQCKEELKGECVTEVEGYYVESVVCVTVGLIWLG